MMTTQHGEHYSLEISSSSFIRSSKIEKSFIRSPCNQVFDLWPLTFLLGRQQEDLEIDNRTTLKVSGNSFFLHCPPLIFIDLLYWQLWRREAGKDWNWGRQGRHHWGISGELSCLVLKGNVFSQHPCNCLVPEGRKDSLLIEVQGQVLVIPMVRQPRKTRLDLQNFSSLQTLHNNNFKKV